MTPATYAVRALRVGRMNVPGPQVFWMDAWDEWLPLSFTVLLIQGEGVTALVNTGPPDDLAPLNVHVRSVLGERAEFVRNDDERIQAQLQRLGVAADDVTHLILIPLQLYATSGAMSEEQVAANVAAASWELTDEDLDEIRSLV